MGFWSNYPAGGLFVAQMGGFETRGPVLGAGGLEKCRFWAWAGFGGVLERPGRGLRRRCVENPRGRQAARPWSAEAAKRSRVRSRTLSATRCAGSRWGHSPTPTPPYERSFQHKKRGRQDDGARTHSATEAPQ